MHKHMTYLYIHVNSFVRSYCCIYYENVSVSMQAVLGILMAYSSLMSSIVFEWATHFT